MRKLDDLTRIVTDSMNEMASGAVQISNAVQEVNEITQKNKGMCCIICAEVKSWKACAGFLMCPLTSARHGTDKSSDLVAYLLSKIRSSSGTAGCVTRTATARIFGFKSRVEKCLTAFFFYVRRPKILRHCSDFLCLFEAAKRWKKFFFM
ncbi:hypothetical protein [Treponema parvum]|uniref:hypothetical protein n=1 Tax=Treponema parvum TaxID=138851 RepID=UPI003D36A38E